METLTPTELLTRSPEIGENPGDTPLSLASDQRLPKKLLWAIASTPVILAPAFELGDLVSASETPLLVEIETGQEFSQALSDEKPFQLGSSDAEADKANRTWLELLARHYVAGKLSLEDEARLAIASERVRRLIPRVTAEDFQELERILADVEHRKSKVNERLRQLGLD